MILLADSEGPDQTAWMHRLIWIFVFSWLGLYLLLLVMGASVDAIDLDKGLFYLKSTDSLLISSQKHIPGQWLSGRVCDQ